MISRLSFTILQIVVLVSLASADGVADNETTSDIHDKMINDIVNKPERKLSTVGPVPVGAPPQAAVLQGSGGLNANELNVIVAPQGGALRNGGGGRGGVNHLPPPMPTTIVVPSSAE